MITTCTSCGKNYEAGSEEQANEPSRECFACRSGPRHTPGPWKVAGIRWEESPGRWTLPIHTPVFIRGVVLGHSVRGRTGADVEANAALVAAAPDLLEACKEAHEWLVAMTLKAAFNQDNKAAQDEASEIVREVSSHLAAAIAKAGGGVP